MGTVKVTYHAPKGDDRVVDTFGATFFDGQAVELNTTDHRYALSKLRNNPLFEVDGDLSDLDAPAAVRRGRLPKASAENAA